MIGGMKGGITGQQLSKTTKWRHTHLLSRGTVWWQEKGSIDLCVQWERSIYIVPRCTRCPQCRANLPTNPPPVPQLIPGIDKFVDILPVEEEPQEDQFGSQDDTISVPPDDDEQDDSFNDGQFFVYPANRDIDLLKFPISATWRDSGGSRTTWWWIHKDEDATKRLRPFTTMSRETPLINHFDEWHQGEPWRQRMRKNGWQSSHTCTWPSTANTVHCYCRHLCRRFWMKLTSGDVNLPQLRWVRTASMHQRGGSTRCTTKNIPGWFRSRKRTRSLACSAVCAVTIINHINTSNNLRCHNNRRPERPSTSNSTVCDWLFWRVVPKNGPDGERHRFHQNNTGRPVSGLAHFPTSTTPSGEWSALSSQKYLHGLEFRVDA